MEGDGHHSLSAPGDVLIASERVAIKTHVALAVDVADHNPVIEQIFLDTITVGA